MKRRRRTRLGMEVLGNFILGVALLTTILAYTPALAQLSDYNPQGLKATTLEEVLALPDEEIDLATAIMILYKEWDPSFDVTGSLEEIDRMALELEARINPGDNPERIVSLINRYLFEESAYTGLADPGYMRKLEYSALPCVIENKKGHCLGLSLLYLALAERLGLPIYGVAAPGHTFVRYDDGKKRINIEMAEKGRESEDSYYEKKYMLHPTYRNYNFYLRNLVKRELIGLFLNNLGVAYGDKGMYGERIAEYKKALEINPNHVEAHNNLGVAYSDKGMYDEAIAEYKKGLEINPNDAKAHLNLGIAYDEKGMHDDAIAEYKKALEINPNDADAHTNLGRAYDEKGMYDEAIAELKRATKINPNYADAHYNLGTAYRHKGMYDEAIAELKRATKINPNHVEAHNTLGAAYDDKGMYDDAIAEYKKALEINPNHVEAHYNLGIAYYGKGMYDEAIAEFKKTIEINPSCANAHANLGIAYYGKGMYDEAIAEFKKVLEINPNDADAHNSLAVVYYAKGEHSLAIEHCDKAIELGYRVHPELLELLKPYREK